MRVGTATAARVSPSRVTCTSLAVPARVSVHPRSVPSHRRATAMCLTAARPVRAAWPAVGPSAGRASAPTGHGMEPLHRVAELFLAQTPVPVFIDAGKHGVDHPLSTTSVRLRTTAGTTILILLLRGLIRGERAAGDRGDSTCRRHGAKLGRKESHESSFHRYGKTFEAITAAATAARRPVGRNVGHGRLSTWNLADCRGKIVSDEVRTGYDRGYC